MIWFPHQNPKKLFASEARLAFSFGMAPPASPGGDTPRQPIVPQPASVPAEAVRPPEVPPPPSAPTEGTPAGSQIEPMRQEGLHTILAAERLNEQQQIATLKNSAEELFREIEERLLIPINGTERDQFEQKKRQVLETLDTNSALLIGWRREHPNIRIQPPSQGLRGILFSDLSLEERSSQLNEYANSFETSGENITEGAKNRMKTILKQYFGALIPLVQDIQEVERKEAIAQLPDNLRQAFQRLQADPAYASLLFDSHRSLERFPPEARDAIRRYRELRARAEVRSASPGATTAPAEGTSGTPRTRSPESSGGRTWDKLIEFFEKIVEMLARYEIAKRTGDISHIRRERQRETTPVTAEAQHIIDGVNAQNPLEVNQTDDNRLEAQVTGKNILAPQDGAVAIAENQQGKKLFFFPNNSDKIIIISIRADETIRFSNIGVQRFDEQNIPLGRLEKKQVPAGSIIASHVNGMLLFGMMTTSGSELPVSETLSYFRGFMRERTTATATPTPAPAPPVVPTIDQGRQMERTPNTPRKRRAEARRTYEALKTLAEETKNLQGSDICRVAVNALANADSGSLEALWRQFPRNPNQQAYETFQGETTNLRAKLQAWKEYPELARTARSRGVFLQQATPIESSGDSGNTARQNIITVVEALKNALQALPQQGASVTQAPPPSAPPAEAVPAAAPAPAPPEAQPARVPETPDQLRASISRNIARINEKMEKIKWNEIPNSAVIRQNAQNTLTDLEGRNADLSVSTDARALRALLRDVRGLSTLLNRYPRA